MTNNQEPRENNSSTDRPLFKRFPTLAAGGGILVVTMALLGGKVFASSDPVNSPTVLTKQVESNTALAEPKELAAIDTTTPVSTEANAEIKDGVQYITSSVSNGSYDPITVQEGIPVKWTLNVPDGALNGCNNVIIIPKYNLQTELKTGENIIEFTPEESGTFPYSCWMGMIRSSITVVGKDGTVAQTEDDGSDSLPQSCCGF